MWIYVEGLSNEGSEISSSGVIDDSNLQGHGDDDSSSRLLDITQTDPLNTFLDYLAASDGLSNTATHLEIGTSSSSLASNISEEKIKLLQTNVAEEGKATLERILTQNNITGSTGSGVMGESRANQNQIYDLNLKSVSLLNFGPYGGDRVFYPLQKRYITSPSLLCPFFLLYSKHFENVCYFMQYYMTLHYIIRQ